MLTTVRTQTRAADAYRRIAEKPTSIVFRTAAGVDLAAQTLRLEYDNGASASESAAGEANTRKLIIFGVRGHATIADSDIKRGYIFVRENRQYEVISVILQTGEIQGTAEVVG